MIAALPQTASQCAKIVVFNATKRRERQMKGTMIGVDLAKNVFQLHGATMTGHLSFRKKLTRSRFRQFMASQPPAVVVMEAGGSASYWAREWSNLATSEADRTSICAALCQTVEKRCCRC
ncbi:hypothetical protein L2331_10045 [Mesorhizobium muleiense]|uniref:hypothetical protein n=1 Tax=unclassified Mesorhizobium TaxID=325217 RepID=UPI000FE4C054|nr:MULTISPECIES: hypothetical protein [Mesorhizobium]MCF6110258.1 hypothetical protein [Mesorhizobium muleiense]RWF14575.1 MAG: hypothetical protein EOS25_26640 [Mesorhizobium sp.]TGS82036.1 hypothetical protein EN818_29395 [Mesorhizobium sp. M3A.F.Ca.ET.175.01.1.1]TGT22304.1 hypothetical protein EN817_27360 [Mesorhizobium sp. M3A.F.Ca.ET.174.01.1.1]TIY04072.1 MAG: hypothetical protein E5V22_12525 [Mesorhizobium sp.]